MRALTLTQPWCGLVASGLKLVENRPRRMIKREDFGKPFAIHASREVDAAVYERIYQIDPTTRPIPDLERSYRHRLSRITSAVIAVATIERAVFTLSDGRIGDAHSTSTSIVDLGDQRRWYFGPIGYVLRDVQALAEPVYCRGWQGFWTLPGNDAAKVEAQIEGSP
jgi:hypothetical protein